MSDEKRSYNHLNSEIVLEELTLGTPMSKIAIKAGSTAKSQQARTQSVSTHINTKKFKAKKRLLEDRLKTHVQDIMGSLEGADLSKVEYRDKVAALDKLTSKIELLAGRATERIDVTEDAVKSFLKNA